MEPFLFSIVKTADFTSNWNIFDLPILFIITAGGSLLRKKLHLANYLPIATEFESLLTRDSVHAASI